MNEFFQRLKQRKLVQWAIAYVAAAFALLQGTDIVGQQFAWPEGARRGITLALVVGFFVTLVLAWYHGERGAQRVTGTELLIIGLVLAFGGGLLWRFAATSRPADAKPAALPNENKTSETTPASPIPAKSIAVLPFDNLSEEKANAYFAEGVQDEILTRLAKVADLKVISRTSTQRFQSTPDNLPQIAKQLGVMHILEGSVQRANDKVRVNVQLINAMTDAHLWAETYDRKLTDIFTVESEIAKTIADMLQAKLSGLESTAMAKKPTANAEAYELYLQGRFFWNKRTGPDLRKSIDYFNQAVSKDPTYALAYAALAQAWLILPAYGGGAPRESMSAAETAINRALALDESSPEAHAALGMLRSTYQFDFPGARTEYERALQLNPNDATSHHWFATDVLAALGESEREIAEMRRARELDPLSLVINTNLGEALRRAGRLDEAIAQLRMTIEMDGSFPFAHHALGIALERKGQLAEALAEYQHSTSLTDDPLPRALAGHLLAAIGQRDEASKILEQLQAESQLRYVDPFHFAIIYLALGNREQALAALEQSYEERNGNSLEYIRTDWMLDPLRGDPRFEALAEKIVPAREFKGVLDKK